MRDGDVVEVTLKSCEFKRVGEKKTPLCEIDTETGEGERLSVAIWMSEKAIPIARQQFKKIGFPIDDRDVSDLPKFIAAAERRVMVTVESYERQGVVGYRGVIEVGGGNSMNKDELSSLTKAMRDAKKKDEKDEPVKAPPPRQTVKMPPVDDDIPF